MRSNTRPIPCRADTQASYDRLSRWYDALAQSSEGPLRQLGLQMLALRDGERVVEIGCGTGDALGRLAQSVGDTGGACGIDLSPGMLGVAQRRVAAMGLALRAGLLRADAIHPPLAAGAFDAAFVSFTLELFAASEIPVVLAACRRLLRPGGRVAVVAMSSRGKGNLMTRAYGWAQQKWPQWVDCRPIRTAETLQEAGLVLRQEMLTSTWGLPVEVVLDVNP
jgi:ubiquinone/menaquinone biosynthesis C-methylase UbiE